MVGINTSYFCTLSTAPRMLSWLAAAAPDLHGDLVAHARGGHGCAANAAKMIWLLDELAKREGAIASLHSMLAVHFPQALGRPAAPAPLASHGRPVLRRVPVFGHFDPLVLTIPRRAIVGSEAEARALLAGKPEGEYEMVDGHAYVEYLTPEMAGLAAQVPAANWLVRVWRANRGKGRQN